MAPFQKPSFCTMLFLNSPPDLHIGVDYCVWKASPKFAGITGLPPGVHYLYWPLKSSKPLVSTESSKGQKKLYSDDSVSTESEDGNSISKASNATFPKQFLSEQLQADRMCDTRCGCFVYLRSGEVLTRRWSTEEEAFVPLSKDEHSCYSDGVLHGDFLENMAPFPKEFIVPWKRSCNFITPSLVDQLEPIKKLIYQDPFENKEGQVKEKLSRLKIKSKTNATLDYSLADSGMDDDLNVSETKKLPCRVIANEAEDFLVSSDSQKHEVSMQKSNRSIAKDMAAPSLPYGVSLFYSSIPIVPLRPNANSAEITRQSMDKSLVLDELIECSYNGNQLGVLGELQFAYIAFLLGYNFASFEQWKSLLILLCNSESAVKKRPALFHGLLSVMCTQIEQAPDDLVCDEYTEENFFIHCIVNLIDICSDEPTSTVDFQATLKTLVNIVQSKFKMDPFELLLRSDEAPQIC